MSEQRTRLVIDTDEDLKKALQLRRIKMAKGTSISDVVNAILREELAEEIAQVEGFDKPEGEAPPKKDRRKKTPPSGSGQGDGSTS